MMTFRLKIQFFFLQYHHCNWLHTLYPKTYEPFTLKDYFGLAMELINISDIMELMAELKYIISCGTIWVGL